jgi:hypothetical protein
MINFRIWLENQLQLPSIPQGFVRLTHFTSRRIAQMLLSGQNFSYKKQGMLPSTTDAFSDNNDVLQLIQSGKTGPYSRKEFGDHVVLMDLPNMDNRIHSNATMAPGEVSNERILGVVDVNAMQFTPNPNYNVNAKHLEIPQEIPQTRMRQAPAQPATTAQPAPAQPAPAQPAANLDIF